MTNIVRNSDNPMITWLGGADCVPMAWRSSDSTITMRVNPVIISSTAGKKERAVKNSSVWIGTEKFVPLLPVPTNKGSVPGVCATAGVYSHSAAPNTASARSQEPGRLPTGHRHRHRHCRLRGRHLLGKSGLRGGQHRRC